MRTTTSISVAALALAGLAVGTMPTAAAGAAATVTERGIVLECTGQRAGLSAAVTLYENDVHTNYVQVILNDNPKRSASREPRDIRDGRAVRTGVRIAGTRARISGTAVKVGRRVHVHEEVDDAGQHIVSDGFHRRLAHDLLLRYRGIPVPLRCDPAFYYKLDVTKTDISD